MNHYLERLQVVEMLQPRLVLQTLLEHVTGRRLTPASLNDLQLGFFKRRRLERLIERIEAYEPLAYVVGHAPFRNLSLRVGPGVLIPRAETEELVGLALPHAKTSTCVLDIGTGSGAIALSLAQESKAKHIYGVDISQDALRYAKKNLTAVEPEDRQKVAFRQMDFFEPEFLLWYEQLFQEHKDMLVVSNLPYIPEPHQDHMDRSVIDYEPTEALFSDTSGLLHIQHLLVITLHNVHRSQAKARLLLEFEPSTKKELESFVKSLGLTPVFHKDLSKKVRFLEVVAS